MGIINKIGSLISFYKNADNFTGIENKNLSELAYKLLENKSHSCKFEHIESVRKTLRKDKRSLQIEDLGAGSTYSKSEIRTVKSIAKSALSSKWQCEILANIIKEFQPENILELGTSLGISTSYLANANKHGTVYTLEGSNAISKVAMQTFASLGLKNIKLILGDFSITLPTIINNLKNIDFAFIDGNHRKSATIDYFENILTKCNENSILVFDDINWSDGMKQAWEIVKSNQKVTASLDFYFFGIIFLNKRYEGHHKIVGSIIKPI